jgi:hypothetical protein
MLLTSIAIAALMAPPTIAAAPDASPSAHPAAAPGEHGKLAWFEGSFEEALAKAKTDKKLVFIDFWTSW